MTFCSLTASTTLVANAAPLRPHAHRARKLNNSSSSARRVLVDVTTRASTTWSLDGVGCAGYRSGDVQLLRAGSTATSTNGAHTTNGANTPRCPLRPINLSNHCKTEGRFVMREAVFELMNGQLFVTSVDNYRNPTHDTDDISGATEQWARNLSPVERMPMVKFYLFLVSVQRAWSVVTSQVAAAVFSDESSATAQVAAAADDDGAAAAALLVDGKPLPAFNRWLLRPGSVLRLGDAEFEVHRNIHAHA